MEIKYLIKGFNHYAIEVRNLSLSINFYRDVLQFPLLKRPDFDFQGAWFDIGNGQQIHLIENKDASITTVGSRSLHFAFEVRDLSELRSYFREKGLGIAKDIKSRPDGVLQMFVKDPDGYYIEFTQIEVRI